MISFCDGCDGNHNYFQFDNYLIRAHKERREKAERTKRRFSKDLHDVVGVMSSQAREGVYCYNFSIMFKNPMII